MAKKKTAKPRPKPSTPALSHFDLLVKQTFGEHAVVGQGMMLVGGGRTTESDDPSIQPPLAKHIVAGIVLAPQDFNPNDPDWQRWDCDVILVPRRKLANNRIYRGGTVDHYLTGGLQRTDGWAKQIFPEEKSIEDVLDSVEQR